MLSRAVVVANGLAPAEDWLRNYLSGADLVVACDGGTNHLFAIGHLPGLFVGDADSVTAEALAWVKDHDVELQKFSADKDETDLELALLTLVEQGFKSIDVVAALGQRVDHELANLMLLTDERFGLCEIKVVSESQKISCLRGEATFSKADGVVLSLIPVHGVAKIKTTVGLRWELNDDQLVPGPARGVSNELVSETASIDVESGLLLAIQTDERATSRQYSL